MLALWFASTALPCTGPVWAHVAHPPRSATARPDSVVWVEFGEGPRPDAELLLVDDLGAEVPSTRLDIGWVSGLFPEVQLEVGRSYEVLAAGDPIADFDVLAGSEPTLAPPVPESRFLYGAYDLDEVCTSHPAFTAIIHDLCTDAPVEVFAIGDTEPGDPLTGDLYVSTNAWAVRDTLEWPELAPDGTGTLWYGTLDGAGRFSGWQSDPFQLPSAGEAWTERNAGAIDRTATTTWTTPPADCEPFTGWEVAHVEPSQPAPTPPIQESSGCSTPGGPGAGWFLTPLLLALRTRR